MIPLPGHPGLDQPVRSIQGVGAQIEKLLHERGCFTVADLLGIKPARYQDRRGRHAIKDLTPDLETMVSGRIVSAKEGRAPKTWKKFFEIRIEDETGQLGAVWFSYPVHMRHNLSKGMSVTLFGRVGLFKKQFQMVHPEVVHLGEGREEPAIQPAVQPVYPEMEEIRPGVLRRIMARVSQELAAVPTIFPRAWLEAKALTDPVTALQTLHRPPADRPGPLPEPSQTKAWRSLAFFELLFLQLTLARSKARQKLERGWTFPRGAKLVEAFLTRQPFRLTPGQEAALGEILSDMAAPRPMNRLLQGDVGSGKTVVCLAACLSAVAGGAQAAIMAPTEILARQHFETLAPMAETLGVKVDLLVGSLSESEKDQRRKGVAEGRTNILIGTHALIAGVTSFARLGLAVIDEQHRFGVAQRLAFRAKADRPDILVMTATPIPRSLALTLYGDLDLTIIKGMPPGRAPIKTRVFSPEDRNEAYQALKREIESGGRAYVVAPRIEANNGDPDQEDLSAAEDLFAFMKRDVLDESLVGLVHGRMKTEAQQAVLSAFRLGDIRALVATTVVEVGLDVPEATFILIEHAERFGLAQLHQLRGRVGRGGRPGKCALVSGSAETTALARLDVPARTGDGFVIAEEDLKLRGPGDPAGFKQSGLPPLDWAKLPQDLPLLLQARELAEEIVAADPELSAPPFKLVRDAVDRLDRTILAQAVSAG